MTYDRITKHLRGTRKTVKQVCLELGIDYEEIDVNYLLIDQCSHCSIWTTNPVEDLDGNPICTICEEHIGL